MDVLLIIVTQGLFKKRIYLYVSCCVCKCNGFIWLFLQNGAFAEHEGDALSFDECMQLLAETFPLDEPAEVITGYI